MIRLIKLPGCKKLKLMCLIKEFWQGKLIDKKGIWEFLGLKLKLVCKLKKLKKRGVCMD